MQTTEAADAPTMHPLLHKMQEKEVQLELVIMTITADGGWRR